MNESPSDDFVMQVNKFAARDRRRTVIGTVVAFAIWLVLAGSSFVVVGNARAKLADTESETKRLTARNAQLRERFDTLSRAHASLESTNTILAKQNNELADLVGKLHGPLAAIVKPELSMQKVNGVTHEGDGLQVYDVILFLRVPQSRLTEIASVDYRIDHPSKINKVMTGRVAATGFAVSYRGYACFLSVSIKVTLVSGEQFTIPYNMCPDWYRLTTSVPQS